MQTTHLQPNRCNSQLYIHSHRVCTFLTHISPLWANQPFVLGCDSSTDHLTAYITHSIQSLASNLPSHIKDTKHNKILIENIPPLLSNTLLGTTDIMSQYRNIPHEEGIVAVIHFMEKYKHLLPTYCPPPNIVRITFDFILKHSPFKFMDTIYTKSLAPPWELG